MIYSFTKSFNDAFSEARGEGKVDVLIVTLGPALTNMMKVHVPFYTTAEQHVSATLSKLGYETHTFGHFKH